MVAASSSLSGVITESVANSGEELEAVEVYVVETTLGRRPGDSRPGENIELDAEVPSEFIVGEQSSLSFFDAQPHLTTVLFLAHVSIRLTFQLLGRTIITRSPFGTTIGHKAL